VHASTLSASAEADTAIANPLQGLHVHAGAFSTGSMQVQASAFSINSLQVQAGAFVANSVPGGQVQASTFDSCMHRQRVQAQAYSVAHARSQPVSFVRKRQGQ
jgi:hypothetical protein